MEVKINLGSHNKRIKGYKNVDGLNLHNVDVVHNLTNYPYPFDSNSVDEILMVEVLEHISWRETVNVLKECHRILKVGGKMHIQVPDCESMMIAKLTGGICAGVPHKPTDDKQVLEHYCDNCEGKGFVHPDRWLMAFCGAAKHEFDHHLNIFTPEILIDNLYNAGFEDIDLLEDKFKWKIKINVVK